MASFQKCLRGGGAGGKAGHPLLDYVILQAAAGLYLAGCAHDFHQATEIVRSAFERGSVSELVDDYVALTRRYASSSSGTGSSEEKQDILQMISTQRRADVEVAKADLPLAEIKARLAAGSAPAVTSMPRRLRAHQPTALIAEVKRASPSSGIIAADVDAGDISMRYAQGGAAVVSVLTEPMWFKGHLEDMAAVRRKLESLKENRPAILRKDFIVDEYQIYESRLFGADAVTLVAAILTDEQLAAFIACARSLHMEVLVEVANEDEMHRARLAGASVVGINNRNLRDYTVDMHNTTRILEEVERSRDYSPSSDIILCALSGISTRHDVQLYHAAGCHAVLVGEALMRARDPRAKIASLLGNGSEPLVKICGIMDASGALQTAGCGADILGFVFVQGSKRVVTAEKAAAIIGQVKAHYAAHVLSDRGRDHTHSGSGDAAGEGDGDGAKEGSCSLLPASALGTIDKASLGSMEYLKACCKILRRACAHRPLFVGVFAGQDPAFVLETARASGVDVVQLSGSETGTDIDALQGEFPVFKTFHVDASDNGGTLFARIDDAVRSTQHAPCAVLLDTHHPSEYGGTGVSFNWSIAQSLSRKGCPFILAGGLRPDNVRESMGVARPFGLDVSSGVETYGAKDMVKVRLFLHNSKTDVQPSQTMVGSARV